MLYSTDSITYLLDEVYNILSQRIDNETDLGSNLDIVRAATLIEATTEMLKPNRNQPFTESKN
jgi:hypothetical protein